MANNEKISWKKENKSRHFSEEINYRKQLIKVKFQKKHNEFFAIKGPNQTLLQQFQTRTTDVSFTFTKLSHF